MGKGRGGATGTKYRVSLGMFILIWVITCYINDDYLYQFYFDMISFDFLQLCNPWHYNCNFFDNMYVFTYRDIN